MVILLPDVESEMFEPAARVSVSVFDEAVMFVVPTVIVPNMFCAEPRSELIMVFSCVPVTVIPAPPIMS